MIEQNKLTGLYDHTRTQKGNLVCDSVPHDIDLREFKYKEGRLSAEGKMVMPADSDIAEVSMKVDEPDTNMYEAEVTMWYYTPDFYLRELWFSIADTADGNQKFRALIHKAEQGPDEGYTQYICGPDGKIYLADEDYKPVELLEEAAVNDLGKYVNKGLEIANEILVLGSTYGKPGDQDMALAV